MIDILEQSTDKILAVKASGILTHEDYENFLPLLDASINTESHIGLYVDISGFEGMTPHAMLDDFLTGIKYYWNFTYVAVVGGEQWMKFLTEFTDWITPSDLEYFDEKDADKAWKWLQDACDNKLN